MVTLPKNFPFSDVFENFLKEYSCCTTYWYVPKARTLNDDNVATIKKIIMLVFEEFLGQKWNHETQDALLKALVSRGILEPYKTGSSLSDRTALLRIWKKLFETLGLLWIYQDKEILITDAGLEVLINNNPRPIIEKQVAKYQYPNPTMTSSYNSYFKGILPHLFLLQVLRECDDYLTVDEYEIFVNLAQGQDDLGRIAKYIRCWRDLNSEEQKHITDILNDVLVPGDPEHTKFNRVKLNASYQRSFYTYPEYLALRADNGSQQIYCTNPQQAKTIIEEKIKDLKIVQFKAIEDWFAYFGDPQVQPSWFTYFIHEIETASSKEEARLVIEENIDKISETETKEIKKKEYEKNIEDLYYKCPDFLEKGLSLVKDGRQYSTPIGRIDLLFKDQQDKYVVVEIKVDEAGDAAFGQILRYIGWVHRNIEDGRNNVRGVILANKFPESARYSRIGLLKDDYQEHIKFKEHGLSVSDT